MKKAYLFRYEDELGNNISITCQPGFDVRQKFEEFLKVASQVNLSVPSVTVPTVQSKSADNIEVDDNFCGAI